ncbi:hypothetical protein GCM10025868_33580 [Angustibacter aerolatus]|uniref:THUMP-like domain-containing protein n=1 Tax=Angustibacter aerolatus TaxID=1162965 RepID=A0ABQ6JIT4_9ACTN|nr:hypothetical protein GCM10025868_33580 [Angustibacter aerolatus]
MGVGRGRASSSAPCGAARSPARASPARRCCSTAPARCTSLLADPARTGRPDVGAPGAFLHEPDGAVVQAGLVPEVAQRLGGRLLDPTIAYVTTDAPAGRDVRPFVHSYAVDDVLPFHVKTLRARLRDLGVGSLTIKKRGSTVDPDALRRRLRLAGDAHATIALTRVAGRQTVLLLRLLP